MGGAWFTFFFEIYLLRKFEICLEVGKNAKVQLCNFPKFDLVFICVSSMGVKDYFHIDF